MTSLLLTLCLYGAPYTTKVGQGTSMNPAFHTGDKILVTPDNFYTVSTGTPVMIWWSGGRRLVLHRLIARRSDGSMITRGDNNRDRDLFYTDWMNFRGVVTLLSPVRTLPSPNTTVTSR